jgi:hypothetical protein
VPRGGGRRIDLRPADPFDLIRWLARSQTDPRKAVAELVQNSIDAHARQVTVERRRLRGGPALVVRDNGEGVLPGLGREEALRFIASNIGSSQKRKLSPEQRRQLVVVGQYGVGLLGFWSIGHRMEIRSRVDGSALYALRLVENQQRGTLDDLPVDIAAAKTFTEIVITELHETASRALAGRRLAEYLAAELRGPILNSGAEVEIKDAMARGLAQKRFPVVPRRFTGEPLRIPAQVPVSGFPPAQVELYLARGAERSAIQVSCAGTLVADDIAELQVLDLAGPPWVGCEIAGVIEFPSFTVPPGTRRGVVPDHAAEAFARAMAELRPLIEEELRRVEHERRAAANRQVVGDLRRALRGLRNRLPQYDLPPVLGAGGGTESSDQRGQPEASEPGDVPMAQPELFPAGPLAAVRIVPDPVEIAPGHEHRARAEAFDSEGRPIRRGVNYRWSIEGAGFSVRGDGARPAVSAAAGVRPGNAARLRVEAESDERRAVAEAAVEAIEPPPDEAGDRKSVV